MGFHGVSPDEKMYGRLPWIRDRDEEVMILTGRGLF